MDVYNTPLLDLVYHAASVHRMYNDPQMVRSGRQSCQPCMGMCTASAALWAAQAARARGGH